MAKKGNMGAGFGKISRPPIVKHEGQSVAARGGKGTPKRSATGSVVGSGKKAGKMNPSVQPSAAVRRMERKV